MNSLYTVAEVKYNDANAAEIAKQKAEARKIVLDGRVKEEEARKIEWKKENDAMVNLINDNKQATKALDNLRKSI
jgi:hypothetical protein